MVRSPRRTRQVLCRNRAHKLDTPQRDPPNKQTSKLMWEYTNQQTENCPFYKKNNKYSRGQRPTHRTPTLVKKMAQPKNTIWTNKQRAVPFIMNIITIPRLGLTMRPINRLTGVAFMAVDHGVSSAWVALTSFWCTCMGLDHTAYGFSLFHTWLWTSDMVAAVLGLGILSRGVPLLGCSRMLVNVYGAWLMTLGVVLLMPLLNSKGSILNPMIVLLALRFLYATCSRVGRHLLPVAIAVEPNIDRKALWSWEGALDGASRIGTVVGYQLVTLWNPGWHVWLKGLGAGCLVAGLFVSLSSWKKDPQTHKTTQNIQPLLWQHIVMERSVWSIAWITLPTYLFYGILTRFLPDFLPLIHITTMSHAATHRVWNVIADIFLLGIFTVIWSWTRPNVQRCRQGMIVVGILGGVMLPLAFTLITHTAWPYGVLVLNGGCLLLGLMYTQWYWGYVRDVMKNTPAVAAQGMLLGTLVLGKSSPAMGLWVYQWTNYPWAPSLWFAGLCGISVWIVWRKKIVTP